MIKSVHHILVNYSIVIMLFVVVVFSPKMVDGNESDDFFQGICSTSIPLTCDENPLPFSYNQSTVDFSNDSSCALGVIGVHDIWFEFYSNGINGNYFYASSANVGMNVYSGSCSNLILYDCLESSPDIDGVYWTGGVLPEGYYKIELLHMVTTQSDETEVIFGCYDDVSSECDVSIKFVDVAKCLSETGYTDVVIGGITSEAVMVVEVLVDQELYFFDCVVSGNSWVSSFEVQGESIFYMSVIGGDSETGCIGNYIEQIDLPITTCEEVEEDELKFVYTDTQFCVPQTAEVKLYQPGTTIIKYVFTATFEAGAGAYKIDEDPPVGVYDIFIKPIGCLQKGYANIELEEGTNILFLQNLIRGDLNNSNSINITDLSIVANSFNTVQNTHPYNVLADINCSGNINISDVSGIGGNFNMVGEIAPMLIP